MPKPNATVENELRDRFDKALDEIISLDEETIDNLLERNGINVYKLESKRLRPDTDILEGSTPAEVKAIYVAHFNSIGKDFKTGAWSSNGFFKKTPLFNHKNHKVNKLKQQINLDLLLAAAGKSKRYFEIMINTIRIIDNAKNNRVGTIKSY